MQLLTADHPLTIDPDSSKGTAARRTLTIGLDLRLARYGGAGVAAVGLAQALVRQFPDHQFVLFACEADPTALGLAASNVHWVPTDVAPLTLRHHWGLRQTFKTHSVDVYLYPHFDMPLCAPVPAAAVIHDLYPMLLPGYCTKTKAAFFRYMTGRTLRRAAAVFCPSRRTMSDIARHWPWAAVKTHLLHWGINRELFSPERSSADNAIVSRLGLPARYLLYVGNHKPHKNLARLIEAFQLASPQGLLDLHLMLTGACEERYDELYDLPARLYISDRVRFLGRVDADCLPALYRRAVALVMPSNYEGFGLPVLEAMACGTPVLASSGGSLPEVGGDAAILFDPADTQTLARAIRRIADGETLRRDLGARGLQRAAAFGWAACGRRAEAVLRGCVARRQKCTTGN